MSETINLKELERKAWRSTYEDGLWDIYYGLIVICLGLFTTRPESGYSPATIIFLMMSLLVCYAAFWAAKRWITLPRMGQVKFGPARKKRKKTLTILLACIVMVQVGFLLVQVIAWQNPVFGKQINGFLEETGLMDLAVAIIGALFVLPAMLLIAYFQDFPRGYYIAVMMSLGIFLLIWLNQAIYVVIVGSLIALPGMVLLVRFIQKYSPAEIEA